MQLPANGGIYREEIRDKSNGEENHNKSILEENLRNKIRLDKIMDTSCMFFRLGAGELQGSN